MDCVLLDLSMPDQSGLEVLPEVKQRFPGSKVIMVTMHADRWLVQESLRRGADGYITKDDGIAEVREGAVARARETKPSIPLGGVGAGARALAQHVEGIAEERAIGLA